MKIKIATDFTDTPGARYCKDGKFSGQEFYESLLKPKFQESLKKKEKLEIDFDDCFGFASSFLDESFGRLSMEFGNIVVLNKLELKSYEDPLLISVVTKIIKNPMRKK